MTKNKTDGVIALIPARYASSRFPGKPLAMIAGVPLIVRVYQKVLQALPAEQIFVATDDKRIIDACESEGIRSIMTSSNCLTGTDRLWQASRELDGQFFINVQGDEPLICKEDILTVIKKKQECPEAVINAMCRLTDQQEIESPHVPKVVVNQEGEMVYMSRAPIPFKKDQQAAADYWRQVCIYGFCRDELKAFASFGKKSQLEAPEDIEILRFLDLGIPVKMVEVTGSSIAVDIPKDIERVEEILERNR